jgi:nitroimidazol reductase NimA-like FMN-containing flavoprotein (pyridoxamine 5'-phosphate oxidase superfamily)
MTSPDQKPSPSNFAELSEDACKELLAQHTAGRVGFMAPDGPQILPVTYQYRNGNVIFRTSPHGAMSSLVRRTSVAFEIDGIDEEKQSGWSVLVLGFAEAMAHNYLLASAWETGARAMGGRSPESVHRNQATQDQRPFGTSTHGRVTLS